ncbi:C-type lectin domain family 6 member A-like [Boleophthalmus pectinirostris]|uniref:C-type lectin domain family 6 member A-like n=1 Tax=Boleophthalmus pectinirostris TaxID=150288 RepID=UPI002430FF70|nr:C-type lectin domain family 6 member A-like [Boleophthalmus pectinirostris]
MKLLILLALFCGAMAQNKDVPEPVQDISLDKGEAQNGLWKHFGETSHVFHSTPQTWANAQMHCLAMGGHLVVLNSKVEEDFVKGLSGGREIWIGLSDSQQVC